jgi:hypothetical protein
MRYEKPTIHSTHDATTVIANQGPRFKAASSCRDASGASTAGAYEVDE